MIFRSMHGNGLDFATLWVNGGGMFAKIYQIPQNAMQSGKAGCDRWTLEFAPSQARKADPLMGWTGSGDTQAQVKLRFDSREEAVAYAKKYGIPARLRETPPHRLKLQSYASNFG